MVEGKRLDTFFELYVKGMPQAPVLRRVLGSVTAEADTASELIPMHHCNTLTNKKVKKSV